jgi:hypothetical protein
VARGGGEAPPPAGEAPPPAVVEEFLRTIAFWYAQMRGRDLGRKLRGSVAQLSGDKVAFRPSLAAGGRSAGGVKTVAVQPSTSGTSGENRGEKNDDEGGAGDEDEESEVADDETVANDDSSEEDEASRPYPTLEVGEEDTLDHRDDEHLDVVAGRALAAVVVGKKNTPFGN